MGWTRTLRGSHTISDNEVGEILEVVEPRVERDLRVWSRQFWGWSATVDIIRNTGDQPADLYFHGAYGTGSHLSETPQKFAAEAIRRGHNVELLPIEG